MLQSHPFSMNGVPSGQLATYIAGCQLVPPADMVLLAVMIRCCLYTYSQFVKVFLTSTIYNKDISFMKCDTRLTKSWHYICIRR